MFKTEVDDGSIKKAHPCLKKVVILVDGTCDEQKQKDLSFVNEEDP